MKTVIENAQIYDGGQRVWPRAAIAFDESGILEVAEHPLPGELVIDAAGKTVLPGLFDCHVHLGVGESNDPLEAAALAAAQANRFLQYGITTVRCCGSADNVDVLVRDLERSGRLEGAAVVASGLGITITGGHAWRMCHQCDTADEIRKAARAQLRAGVDQVKLFASGGMGTKSSDPDMLQFSAAEMRAAVEEAEKKGALTCAHATGLSGAKEAIRAGVRSIEHTQLDQECVELMLEHGTWYCSTIVTRYGIVNSTQPEYEWMRQKAAPTDIPNMMQAIRYCKQYGIPMAAGTDAGFDEVLAPIGASLHQELWLYTQAGLSPQEALYTATGAAARLCRLENSTGTLRPGLAADLVLVDGDPLQDIGQLNNIAMTFHRGRCVYQNTWQKERLQCGAGLE